jgi:hypothetical protein
VHPGAPELEFDVLPLEELETLLLTVADADEPPVLLDAFVLSDPPVLVDPPALLLETPVFEVPVSPLDELALLVEFVELLVLPPQPAMFAAAIVAVALIASSNSTRRLRMIRPPCRRVRGAPALQTDNIVRSR